MTGAADDDPSGGDLADESDDFDSDDFDSDEMPSPGDWTELARQVLDATVYSAINPDEYKPVKIGRFDAVARIGEGGFGTVFKAHDPEFDRLVALKLCRTRSRHVAEAIMAEARALAKLDHHPNIVTVYEPGRHDGGVFFAMQYIEGEDVALFGEPGDPRPTVEEIIDIYRQIGRGLAAAHRAGFVHGDIKPSNMLLDLNKFARLADFGLAQKVIRGAPESMRDGLRHRSGTLEFMAPEVLLGGSCSQAADQWALCVSILTTLYGWPPFRGTSTAALLEDIHLNRLEVIDRVEHPGLREILRVGLSLDPRDRFVDVDALVAALDRLREPGPVSSSPGEPESDESESDESDGPERMHEPESDETALMLGEPDVVGGEPPSHGPEAMVGESRPIETPELTPLGGGPAPSHPKRGARVLSASLVLTVGLTLGWLGRARVEGPRPSDDPVPLPYAPCVLGQGVSMEIDPVVLAVCTYIRRGQIDDADKTWKSVYLARWDAIESLTAAAILEPAASATLDPAEAATLDPAEAADELAVDTMIIVQTFQEWAKHSGGPDVPKANTLARRWALDAEKAWSKATSIREKKSGRAEQLAPN